MRSRAVSVHINESGRQMTMAEGGKENPEESMHIPILLDEVEKDS